MEGALPVESGDMHDAGWVFSDTAPTGGEPVSNLNRLLDTRAVGQHHDRVVELPHGRVLK